MGKQLKNSWKAVCECPKITDPDGLKKDVREFLWKNVKNSGFGVIYLNYSKRPDKSVSGHNPALDRNNM
jgi:hypothetical protein